MSKSETDGAVGGVAPFGYRWERGTLVIDSSEAPVRKLIYQLFIKHRRKKTVARILNELGHRTRRGSEFHDTSIRRLIADPTAKGTWTNGERTLNVEPILAVELWEHANTILNGAKPAKQPAHTFAGIVYCMCGERMVNRENSPNFICSGCRRKIAAADLEEILVLQLRSERPHDGLSEVWARLGPRDKRIVVEQLCERIVVGQNTIDIEFGLAVDDLGPDPPADAAVDAEPNTGPSEVGRDDLDEPLLTETEAARFLGVSKMTVSRKRRSGELGFFVVGSRFLYSRKKHLLVFLADQQQRVSPGT